MKAQQLKKILDNPFYRAFAEGKTVQIHCSNGAWVDMEDMDSLDCYVYYKPDASDIFRIKPEPCLVPLTVEDIKPGMALRKEGEVGWRLILSAVDQYVCTFREKFTFSRLFEDTSYRISSDMGQTWTCCSKLKP